MHALPEDSVSARVITSKTGIILSATPPLAAMFGYAISELVQKNVSLLMPASYAAHHGS